MGDSVNEAGEWRHLVGNKKIDLLYIDTSHEYEATINGETCNAVISRRCGHHCPHPERCFPALPLAETLRQTHRHT